MRKRILIFIFVITLVTVIIFGFFLYGSVRTPDAVTPIFAPQNISPAHAYKQPEVSIENVRIKAFYVVPQEAGSFENNWKDILEEELKRVQEFHDHQFNSASQLEFDIYPDPIILLYPENNYNTQEEVNSSFSLESSKTSVRIAEEIEHRALRPGGDLYNTNFSSFMDGEYPVLGMLYEKGGTSWGAMIVEENSREDVARQYNWPLSRVHEVNIETVDGFFIVGRTSKAYNTGGSSVFYHEFAHALGLPDAYNFETPTNGIMGSGLYRPLNINYIDASLLNEMGIKK